MDVDVNWYDPALQRWMNSISRQSTRYAYRNAWKTYVLFTGLQASDLITEAIEDQQRPILERQDIVKKRLLDFYYWNLNEAPVYRRGSGNEIIGKGVKSKTASGRVSTIRSFYATFDITVRLRGRSRLPKPRVENKRLIVDNEQVRILLQHTTSPRDRSIILTLFQGGMDVSTLCSMNYSHVRKGLEGNKHPLKLELIREKSDTEYYTFLGRDAITAIKAYLRDMDMKGITFTDNMPLFLKAIYTRPPQRITTTAVQKVLREAAHRSPFVDTKNNGKDFNPLSPHALRESFGSIMSNKGVPDNIIDFWLGHSVGEIAEAYKRVQFDELKRIYAEREIFFSVTAPTSDIEERVKQQVEETKHNITREFQQSKYELQSLVNALSSKNLAMERELQELTHRNQQLEVNLQSVKTEVIDDVVGVREQMEREIQRLTKRNTQLASELEKTKQSEERLAKYIKLLYDNHAKLQKQIQQNEAHVRRMIELSKEIQKREETRDNAKQQEDLKENQQQYDDYLQSLSEQEFEALFDTPMKRRKRAS